MEARQAEAKEGRLKLMSLITRELLLGVRDCLSTEFKGEKYLLAWNSLQSSQTSELSSKDSYFNILSYENPKTKICHKQSLQLAQW